MSVPTDERVRLRVIPRDAADAPTAERFERVLNHLINGTACQRVLRRYTGALAVAWAKQVLHGVDFDPETALLGFAGDMEAAMQEDHDE